MLTEHLDDREGTPTRAALDQVLTFFYGPGFARRQALGRETLYRNPPRTPGRASTLPSCAWQIERTLDQAKAGTTAMMGAWVGGASTKSSSEQSAYRFGVDRRAPVFSTTTAGSPTVTATSATVNVVGNRVADQGWRPIARAAPAPRNGSRRQLDLHRDAGFVGHRPVGVNDRPHDLVERLWSSRCQTSVALTQHQQTFDELLVAFVGGEQLVGEQRDLIRRASARHADLDEGALHGERRPKLVRGVGREAALTFVTGREPIHHVVQRGREAHRLVLARSKLASFGKVLRAEPPYHLRHRLDRAERPDRDSCGRHHGDRDQRRGKKDLGNRSGAAVQGAEVRRRTNAELHVQDR